jgi:regulatory protein
VAQSWRVRQDRAPKPRPPLDEEGLERLALFYAGRYATTRAKLRAYLKRKVAERGWGGTAAPSVEALVAKLAELRYVDDRAFASARAASLGRRGFGERRVAEALRAAGIEAEDAGEAHDAARGSAWAAALRFAERRRLGPFAAEPHDPVARRKATGAMLRAGHPMNLVHRILNASPGEIPDSDGH